MRRYAGAVLVGLVVFCAWAGMASGFDGFSGSQGPGATTIDGSSPVAGPASATDNAIVRFDGTTGKLLQNSAVTVADTTGTITFPVTGQVVLGASTSGALLEVDTGVLVVREGDDSADAPLQVLSLTSPTVTAATSISTATATATAALILNSADTSGIRLEVNAGILSVREGDDSALASMEATGFQSGVNALLNGSNTDALRLINVRQVGWSSTGSLGAPDTGLVRNAAAVVKVTNGSTGDGTLNTATGTASAPAYSYDDDQNTGMLNLAADQLAVSTNGLVRKVFGGQITLTDAAATTIFTVALAAGQRAGGHVTYSIEVTDGTDFQVLTGAANFSAVDKAGTLTSEVVESFTAASSNAESSVSTLTDTWTISDGANAFAVQVNADTSLAGATITIRFAVDLFGNAATITVP